MHLDYTEICIDLIPALIYQHMKICLTTMSYIKCPFDVLSNRWRILHTAIYVHVDFAIDIVIWCCDL